MIISQLKRIKFPSLVLMLRFVSESHPRESIAKVFTKKNQDGETPIKADDA